MTTLPTGETLPEYDDQHPEGVDIEALRTWLYARRGWGHLEGADLPGTGLGLIRDVLAALQAVGDATLVKNGTYRLMRRDGADIERLAALLSRVAPLTLVKCGGNPVDAVAAITSTEVNHVIEQPTGQSTGPSPVIDALTQLNDPRLLLAEALATLRRAQKLGASPVFDNDLNEAERLMDESFQLSRVAEIASTLDRDARQATVHAIDDPLDDPEGMRAVPSMTHITNPEAVQLRFTAKVAGLHLGFVGGREWIWAPGVGYIDIAGSHTVEAPVGVDPDKLITYHFRGRIVSVDGDTALVVSDGGYSSALPLFLLTTEPDE